MLNATRVATSLEAIAPICLAISSPRQPNSRRNWDTRAAVRSFSARSKARRVTDDTIMVTGATVRKTVSTNSTSSLLCKPMTVSVLSFQPNIAEAPGPIRCLVPALHLSICHLALPKVQDRNHAHGLQQAVFRGVEILRRIAGQFRRRQP